LTSAVEYTYVCDECEYSKQVLKDEIKEEITCPNCGGDISVMWFAHTYEDYLKDQGLDKSDPGTI
jgi:DNA-directed RNA polymerase subunit RPC12/RpoP